MSIFRSVLTLLFLSVVSDSALASDFCLRAIRKAITTGELNAVELEIPTTNKALSLMHTSDGTVGPVLNWSRPPEWLAARAESEGIDPRKYPWSKLSETERLEILQEGARSVTFYQSRSLPGIHMVDEIPVTLTKGAPFQNQELPAGTHNVNVKDNWGAVEYIGPEEVENVKGLELHYRDKQSAGKTSRDAWTLIARSEIAKEKPHQHVHIVRKISDLLPPGSTVLAAAKVADFKRRIEVFLHMQAVLLGYPVSHIEKVIDHMSVDFWGPMTETQMKKMTGWLESLVNGESSRVQSRAAFKISYVGLRGPKTYKSTEPLLGLEVRAIYPPERAGFKYEREVEEMLNAIETSYSHPEFGLSRDRMKKWRAKNPRADLPSQMVDIYYNKEDLMAYRGRMSEKTLEFMDSDVTLWLKVMQLSQKNQAFKMLIHNWSRDPLFFDSPRQIEKIARAQQAALKTLATASTEEPERVLRNFILDSGLFKSYANSIGLYPDPRSKTKIEWFKNRPQ